MKSDDKRDLVILGAGGYAHQIYWAAQRANEFNIVGLLDETIREGDVFYYQNTMISSDFKTLSGFSSELFLVCAIGDIKTRKRWVKEYEAEYKFVSIVDPSAMIAPDAYIGKNVVILGGTICSSMCRIEDNVNINWQCLISHDVIIGKFTNLSSGVKLTGGVKVGQSCDLGTNATVIPQKKLGDSVILGAGAVVVQDIPSNTTAVGIPARTLKRE